jgi:thioredoxin-like negative regulator of GroEL
LVAPSPEHVFPEIEDVVEQTDRYFVVEKLHSPRSGRCRRVEGFLAQVLQHRRNHDTLVIRRVSVDERPDLAERFRVTTVPTLLLIHDHKVQRRITDPKGASELAHQLSPRLRANRTRSEK